MPQKNTNPFLSNIKNIKHIKVIDRQGFEGYVCFMFFMFLGGAKHKSIGGKVEVPFHPSLSCLFSPRPIPVLWKACVGLGSLWKGAYGSL
jgi:hypothetical protein